MWNCGKYGGQQQPLKVQHDKLDVETWKIYTGMSNLLLKTFNCIRNIPCRIAESTLRSPSQVWRGHDDLHGEMWKIYSRMSVLLVIFLNKKKKIHVEM